MGKIDFFKMGGGVLLLAMLVAQGSSRLGGYIGLIGIIFLIIGFIKWTFLKLKG